MAVSGPGPLVRVMLRSILNPAAVNSDAKSSQAPSSICATPYSLSGLHGRPASGNAFGLPASKKASTVIS